LLSSSAGLKRGIPDENENRERYALKFNNNVTSTEVLVHSRILEKFILIFSLLISGLSLLLGVLSLSLNNLEAFRCLPLEYSRYFFFFFSFI